MSDDLTFTIYADGPLRSSWRFLWAKHVTGFAQHTHCARCLKGHYETRFGLDTPIGVKVALTGYKHGDIIYFCGVSKPYNWEKNLHLAVRVARGKQCGILSVNGDRIHITGAETIEFNDASAISAFPSRGKEYLTCRNFQFGAEMVARGAL